MPANSGKKNKNYLKVKSIFGRKDNQAKLFFLFLALFLWVIINLSKEEGYTQTLDFPVKFQNLPENKELKNKLPSEISLKIKAPGFDLLKYRLANFNPIVIDVSELQTSDGKLQSFWITNSKRSYIQNQLASDVKLIQILPDTIFFEYEALISKKVLVVLDLDTDFDSFTTFYSTPELTPDSVTILGNEEDLAKIDSIVTSTLVVTNDMETLEETLGLKLVNENNVNYSANKVKVKLKVAKLTEKLFEQEVELRQVPDNVEVVVFPKQVSVKVQLALEDYERIKSIQVRAFVNVAKGLTMDKENFLNVQLDSLPDFVRRATIEPRRVEYIISKK